MYSVVQIFGCENVKLK